MRMAYSLDPKWGEEVANEQGVGEGAGEGPQTGSTQSDGARCAISLRNGLLFLLAVYSSRSQHFFVQVLCFFSQTPPQHFRKHFINNLEVIASDWAWGLCDFMWPLLGGGEEVWVSVIEPWWWWWFPFHFFLLSNLHWCFWPKTSLAVGRPSCFSTVWAGPGSRLYSDGWSAHSPLNFFSSSPDNYCCGQLHFRAPRGWPAPKPLASLRAGLSQGCFWLSSLVILSEPLGNSASLFTLTR